MRTLSLLSVAMQIAFASWPDTTSTEVVTNGVVHTQYTLPGPFTLDVLEIDTKAPYIQFESYRPNGLTKTTVQAAANDQPGHRVIGAINADFFSFETGWPIHNQVVNGKAVLGISSIKSSFAVTSDRRVVIDGFSFTGSLKAKNGSVLTLTGSNTTRNAAQTVLFSSYKGAATGTDATGQEAALKVLSDLSANDTLTAVVTQKGSGNLAIPGDGYVVSGGSGSPATFVANALAVGDTVRLYLNYVPRSGADIKRITQLITGNGRLIKDGVAYPAIGDYDQSGSSFNEARHPRTFVGYNDDTSKVYFCTVDGRQTSSLGMSFTEMANFLLAIGVKDAFNLDGGGSTTMVVRGAVVNSPSDPGGERSVANSLHVVSTAPVGTLHFLNLLENRRDVFQGLSYQFHAEGKDEHRNPLPLPAGTTWECTPSIGTVSASGLFMANQVNDSGWVTVRYNGIADSARVYVRIVKELRVYPASLSMVPGEQVSLTIYGIDTGNNDVLLEGNQVFTSIAGPNIHFDAGTRTVTAQGFGKGTITISLDTVKRAMTYDFSGVDTTVFAERFDDLFLWSQDVTGTDPDNVFFGLSTDTAYSAPGSYRVFYSFPTTDAVVAQLRTDLPLASRPDSIFLKVYGNGGGHTLRLLFTDKDGESFSITSPSSVTWNGTWQNVGFKMVNAKPVTSGTLDFPVTLREVQVSIGEAVTSGSKAVGTIFLDDITVHYPNRAVAPSVLYDFNSGITGWLQPFGVGSGQTVGILTTSKLEHSAEQRYEGSGSGKWTLIDDPALTTNWNIRIARTTSAELADMLRGSYIGAWVWANGSLGITMRTVIRGGASGLCQGPAFPVNHTGWKLIGVRLDAAKFTTYITSGTIVDAGNKFNGFHVEANNATVDGKTVVFYVDKMVTSALTVPSGFIDFGAAWDSTGRQVRVAWGVNSEISINRYVVERSNDGTLFAEVGSVPAVGNADTTQRYSYYDDIGALTSAVYRIRQITNDGGQTTTPAIAFTLSGAASPEFTPHTFALYQNYPNPFNPVTTIRFTLPSSAYTSLTVYDLLGRKVSTLVDGTLSAGTHTANWDSTSLSSGVYLYRLNAGPYSETRKMLVAK